MNSITRIMSVATMALIVGGIGGMAIGSKANNAQWGALFREFALVNAAKETAIYTNLLKGLHENKQDLVLDRLEVLLNSALIHIGFEYSPERDCRETVARSIALARDYRAAHPYKPSIAGFRGQINAALAIRSPESNHPPQTDH